MRQSNSARPERGSYSMPRSRQTSATLLLSFCWRGCVSIAAALLSGLLLLLGNHHHSRNQRGINLGAHSVARGERDGISNAGIGGRVSQYPAHPFGGGGANQYPSAPVDPQHFR